MCPSLTSQWSCVCVYHIYMCRSIDSVCVFTAHTPAPCGNVFLFGVKSPAHPAVMIFPPNTPYTFMSVAERDKNKSRLSLMSTHTFKIPANVPKLCCWLKRCRNEKNYQLKHFRESCLIIFVSFAFVSGSRTFGMEVHLKHTEISCRSKSS